MQRTRWFVILLSLLTVSAQAAAADGVPELVRTAASADANDPNTKQAIEQLKKLGLAEHVVPLLEKTDRDAATIELQQAAVRVLRRSQFKDALDNLGELLSIT